MIYLSLNIQEIGGSLKIASILRLLDKTCLYILFLQETLVPEQKDRYFMSDLRPSWVTCVVNSVGTSGGLLVTWDPNKIELVPYLFFGGILLTRMCIASKRKLTLLNTYDPCVERNSCENFLQFFLSFVCMLLLLFCLQLYMLYHQF